MVQQINRAEKKRFCRSIPQTNVRQVAPWTISPRQLAPDLQTWVDKRTKNNMYDVKSWVHIFSDLFGSVVDKRTRGVVVWRLGVSCLGLVVQGASCPDTPQTCRTLHPGKEQCSSLLLFIQFLETNSVRAHISGSYIGYNSNNCKSCEFYDFLTDHKLKQYFFSQ